MKKQHVIIAMAALLATGASAGAKDKKHANDTQKGELQLFEMKDYNGQTYVINSTRPSVQLDWNIGSIGIAPGDKWEICAGTRYRPPCMTLTESVPDSAAIGIAGGIGSARPAQ